jgi:hypothetical protein
MGNRDIWLFGYLVIDCMALTVLQAPLMGDQSEQLKQRTMQFALDVLHLIDTFPVTTSAQPERLHKESIELRAIFGRSLATARLNRFNRLNRRNSPNNEITR